MTPPRERRPIITRLAPFSEDIVRTGTVAELHRGGQVFFVNDNVKALPSLRTQLERLLPSAKIGVAHGQLPGRQLEKTMLAFLHGDIHVLLCTTIIEAGIDLPNVNTIFVNNAHNFGLSQIHQMRGRVGRSDRQAFCYLMIPGDKKPTASALDRLKTVEYHTSLGSGYALALKDLEMRGAGNLFGVEQSGHIASVGFHLFCKIVEEAASRRLKGDSKAPEMPSPDVSFAGTAMIPTSYVSDVGDRLHFYRRLSTCRDRRDVADVARELKDRYGPIPPPADNLLTLAAYQFEAKQLAMRSVTISDKGLRVVIAPWKRQEALLSYVEEVQSRFQELHCQVQLAQAGGGGVEITISKDFQDPHDSLVAAQYLFESDRTTSNFD